MCLNSAYIECVNFLTTKGIDKPLSISLILDFIRQDYSIYFFKIELSKKFVFVEVSTDIYTKFKFYNSIDEFGDLWIHQENL